MINNSIVEIKNIILPILKYHNVRKAAIFGSYARCEARKDSDVDILVQFGGDESLIDLVRLEFELQKKLGKKVDVLTFNAIHHSLRQRIMKEQQKVM